MELMEYFKNNPISISFDSREDCVRIHKIMGHDTTFRPEKGIVSFWYDKGHSKYPSKYRCSNWDAMYKNYPYINISAEEFFMIVDDNFSVNVI